MYEKRDPLSNKTTPHSALGTDFNRALHLPVTEIARDNAEGVLLSQVRRKQLPVYLLRVLVDCTYKYGNYLYVIPDKKASMNRSKYTPGTLLLKHFSNVRQMHFDAVLVTVGRVVHVPEHISLA